MTDFHDPRRFDDLIADQDHAARQLASDLETLYAGPVPGLRFNPQSVASRVSPRRLGRWWQPAGAVAVAGIALAAVLIVPSLRDGESEVSAATVLARASDAAESNAPAVGEMSYHLVATWTSEGQTDVSTTETWYLDADHVRTEQDYDAAASGPEFGVAVNGDDAWIYGTFDGTSRAVHGPAADLGAMFGGVDPAATTDIGEVLAQYSGACQSARLEADGTIAGRAAYQVVVSPDLGACPAYDDGLTEKDIAGKLGTLRLWVDKETFLPLKTEQQDGAGGLAYVYEVTQIAFGGEIPGSTFNYTTPDGSPVVDVADVTEAKNVLSGYVPNGTSE